jgi:hypothetical protein
MVIGPGLLIARRWRTLAGATIGGVVVLVASLLLAGLDGVLEDARLIFLYSGNVPSTVPRDMMNWRSLAIHLSNAFPAGVAWSFAMVGLGITYVAGLSLWTRFSHTSQLRFAVIILASYAATCATAWHSHSHMSLPMAIPLIYLAARAAISYRTLAVWLIGPYLVFAVLRIVFDLGNVGVLGVNLYLLGWALWKASELSTDEAPTPVLAVGGPG